MKRIDIVAVGDSLITMKQSVHSEPEFLEMVDIIRRADLAFTNLEMLLHDFEGYPAAESGGTYVRAPPSMVEELKWMGFDLVSTANNHSLDYTYGGLLRTIEVLDAAGIPHAGTGLDLANARKPTYLETAKGRVALIAASSTFASFGRAGATRRDIKGRPGLNPLRFEKSYTVAKETLEKLKEVAKEANLAEVVQPEDAYYFLHQKFVVGDKIGSHTTPHEGDLKGNLESIREAARQADWVLFSLHAHEGRDEDDDKPAEFIESFARACIDEGTHALIGHGHHGIRGIEIRNGRPIFYSLGNFIFQNETVEKMPADFYETYKLDPYSGTPADAFDARQKAPPRYGYPHRKWFTEDEKYWSSIIAQMRFEEDRLTELKLYPIDLGREKPRSQRGSPMLADPEKSRKILEKLQKLSDPYGTEIMIDNNIGVVRL
ncbi:CapA family protein [Candidatus Bathyarchaeota archaeon]|nr:CapA family protein [Candidatus Bathyarchaeota archaeon]